MSTCSAPADLSATLLPGMIAEVTVADDHLARIGSVLDDWDREDAASQAQAQARPPDPAREALVLREALQPIIGITIRLGAGKAPG
jgi:hypothetical protein